MKDRSPASKGFFPLASTAGHQALRSVIRFSLGLRLLIGATSTVHVVWRFVIIFMTDVLVYGMAFLLESSWPTCSVDN